MQIVTSPIRRVLLLVNPHASGAEEVTRQAGDCLRAADVTVTEIVTESAEHLCRTIREHKGQVDVAILIGGDGTLHHALGELHEQQMPVGLLPGGTANDFARCLNTPEDITKACRGFLQGRKIGVDLAFVNDRPFLNVCHIGPAAQVASESSSEAKRWLGPLEYLRRGIQLFMDHQPYRANVAHDDQQHELTSIQVSVGNAPYFGGGNLIYAGSAINDHQLYLYSMRPVKLWHLLLVVPLLRRGRGNRTHGVDRLHGQTFRIETSRPQPISADGENMGTTPAEFRIVPNAIEFLMPNEELHPNDHPHILLDDRQVALQDVISSLYEAADYYGEAAPRLEDEPLGPLLDQLGAERRAAARELGDIVLDLGALPRHPDPDRETLEHISDWFRTHLTEDWRSALIETCVERDREILARIDKCRACDLAENARQTLDKHRRVIETGIKKLEAAAPATS